MMLVTFLWSDDNVWNIFDPDQIHKMSIFPFGYSDCFLCSKLFFGNSNDQTNQPTTSNDAEYQVLNIKHTF